LAGLKEAAKIWDKTSQGISGWDWKAMVWKENGWIGRISDSFAKPGVDYVAKSSQSWWLILDGIVISFHGATTNKTV